MVRRRMREAAGRHGEPQARLGGWLWAVLAWISGQCVLAAVIVIVFASDGSLEAGGVALPFGYLYWSVLLAGPPIALTLLLRRSAAFPAVYASYIAAVIALEVVGEVLEPDYTRAGGPADPVAAAVVLAATVIDLVVVAYLFFGRRPAQVFRRTAAMGEEG